MTVGNFGIDYTRSKALDYTSYNYETSMTQPASFGCASGDFDGAGGSYGLIQWNWKSGTCQPIFRDMVNLHAADLQSVITTTADYNTFVDVVLNRTTANQMAWGTSITDMTNKHKILEPWATYFKNMGNLKSYQDRQLAAVKPYYNTADQWASDFGLWSRRGYGLCFDNAVQYGGMNTTCHTDILNFAAGLPTYYAPEFRELKIMRYFAWRVCQDHQGTYYQSALDRRNAIANGSGNVYGYPVDSTPYDLVMEPNGLLAVPDLKKPKILRRYHIFRG
jgi:hypothetical protein